MSAEDAKRVGDRLGLRWDAVAPESFRQGLDVELEHGTRHGPATNLTNDDLEKTGRIALAHLIEDPQYYERLARMEREGEAYWASRQKPRVFGGGERRWLRPLALAALVLAVALLAVWLWRRARQPRGFAPQPEARPFLMRPPLSWRPGRAHPCPCNSDPERRHLCLCRPPIC